MSSNSFNKEFFSYERLFPSSDQILKYINNHPEEQEGIVLGMLKDSFPSVFSALESAGYTKFSLNSSGLCKDFLKASTDYRLWGNKDVYLKLDLNQTAAPISVSSCSDSFVLNDQNFLFKLLDQNITNPLILDENSITISSQLNIKSDHDVTLISRNNITFKDGSRITKGGKGNLYLKAGIGNTEGKVKFVAKDSKYIYINDSQSNVYIHYHPTPSMNSTIYGHKYHNPENYYQYVSISSITQIKQYMFVNDAFDLQNMRAFLHANYALSNDIDASITRNWYEGKGFKPVMIDDGIQQYPSFFSGNFDGNGFKIEGLYIKRCNENYVGLFGGIFTYSSTPVEIKNLDLRLFEICGNNYVGSVSGIAKNVNFASINIAGIVNGTGSVGLLSGVVENVKVDDSVDANSSSISGSNCYGGVVGAVLGEDGYNFCSAIVGGGTLNCCEISI